MNDMDLRIFEKKNEGFWKTYSVVLGYTTSKVIFRFTPQPCEIKTKILYVAI
jgi:hypothetical protein